MSSSNYTNNKNDTTNASHRGAAARPDSDMARHDRLESSEDAGKEQEARFLTYAFKVDEFDKATAKHRHMYQYGQTQKALRDGARAKVAREIAEAKEVIRKGEASLAAMQAADDVYQSQHHHACEQGEADAFKLEKYRGYLSMEHDEEPTELQT